jgi:hypothetical protein
LLVNLLNSRNSSPACTCDDIRTPCTSPLGIAVHRLAAVTMR